MKAEEKAPKIEDSKSVACGGKKSPINVEAGINVEGMPKMENP